MLSKRIIPCLDVTNGRVVKGTKFVNLRDAGDPVECAEEYNRQGADELVFLDITASSDHRATMVDVVARTAERCFMPVTVGGGIRSVEDFRIMLNAGADKVSVNTAAVFRPELVREAASKFGRQCVVVAIDAKRKTDPAAQRSTPNAQRPTSKEVACRSSDSDSMPETCNVKLETPMAWEVYTHGGRKPTDRDAVEWAKKVEALGAGEILLTSMDADGTKAGYDLDLTRAVSEAVRIPVIASGGAGRLEHLRDVLTQGKADAVLAASIFHFNEHTVADVKRYLRSQGIEVRL